MLNAADQNSFSDLFSVYLKALEFILKLLRFDSLKFRIWEF